MEMADWYVRLSADSPDWYKSVEEEDGDTLPFFISFVEAGSRIGYRWGTEYGDSCCEVNWLDPEPDTGSSDYENYIEKLERINNEVNVFRGFHQPPTEEEYRECIFRKYISCGR